MMQYISFRKFVREVMAGLRSFGGQACSHLYGRQIALIS